MLIHAAVGAALLLALLPAPSVVRVPVDIDLVPSGVATPPRVTSVSPATPYVAAAPGASSVPGAARSPAPAAASTTRGADAPPDTQAGGDSTPVTDWDMTSPGKDRPPVFVVRPEIPGWVNARAGVLTVTVSFVVSPNGIVSGARVASSCGFPDVDSAVVDAVMMWHFTSDPSAGTATSTIRYVVKGRGAR